MSDRLLAALVEAERHIGTLGWDQPPRLFALVRTADLTAAEPHLAEALKAANPDGYTSVEQDDFKAGADLGETLAELTWPSTVHGCALSLERAFLPADAEQDLPDDPEAAAQIVADHPRRLELRVVVGVTRDGERHGVARVRNSSEDLMGGPDLVPALADALAHTFE